MKVKKLLLLVLAVILCVQAMEDVMMEDATKSNKNEQLITLQYCEQFLNNM